MTPPTDFEGIVTLSHRIQVALYSILIEHVLAGRDGLHASRTGGVWLAHTLESEWFDLSRVRPPLEMFLTHELSSILEPPASEAF